LPWWNQANAIQIQIRVFGNEVNGKDIGEYRLFGFYQHFIKFPKMMAIFIFEIHLS